MSRPLIESGRMDALIDGIFAIASTLLVLELTSHAIGNVTTSGEFLAGLLGMGDQFISFLVSFLLLCLLWMAHVRLFTYIAYIDGNLMRINVLQLLFIVLIPFTTALTSEYNDYYAGRVLLPVDFFLVALFGHLSWRWAAARGGPLMTGDAYAARAVGAAGGLAAVSCAAIAVAASPWIGSFAFFAFLLNGPLAALFQRGSRTGRDAGTTAG